MIYLQQLLINIKQLLLKAKFKFCKKRIQNQPGMICPVVTYAPTAATNPNIAAQPLKRSASGVIIKKFEIYMNYCNRNYEAL